MNTHTNLVASAAYEAHPMLPIGCRVNGILTMVASIVLVLISTTATMAQSTLSTTVSVTQQIEGVDTNRTFIVHLPEELQDDAKLPVLFAFHGTGGQASEFVPAFE